MNVCVPATPTGTRLLQEVAPSNILELNSQNILVVTSVTNAIIHSYVESCHNSIIEKNVVEWFQEICNPDNTEYMDQCNYVIVVIKGYTLDDAYLNIF
jgi:hypothetical protein